MLDRVGELGVGVVVAVVRVHCSLLCVTSTGWMNVRTVLVYLYEFVRKNDSFWHMSVLLCYAASRQKALPHLHFTAHDSALQMLLNQPSTKLLGAGTFGRVYSAVDNDTQSRYAVKHIVRTDSDLNSIEHEFKATRECHAANPQVIIDMLSMHTEGYNVFLKMELMEIDLARLLNSEQPTEPVAKMRALIGEDLRQLVVNTQAMLAVLRSMGLIHADIKPLNILCKIDKKTGREEALVIKLADFGLALPFTRQKQYPRNHVVTHTYFDWGIRTPPFPEGSNTAIEGGVLCQVCDHKTDLFSMGLVLYEVFSFLISKEPPTPLMENEYDLRVLLLRCEVESDDYDIVAKHITPPTELITVTRECRPLCGLNPTLECLGSILEDEVGMDYRKARHIIDQCAKEKKIEIGRTSLFSMFQRFIKPGEYKCRLEQFREGSSKYGDFLELIQQATAAGAIGEVDLAEFPKEWSRVIGPLLSYQRDAREIIPPCGEFNAAYETAFAPPTKRPRPTIAAPPAAPPGHRSRGATKASPSAS